MVTPVRVFGSSRERAMVLANDSPLASHMVSKAGAVDTIYPWWMDEREFPRRAVMTEWFYNPLKGQPRYVDIYHMRQMAASEWVTICTNTIIEEVCQVPWEIVPKDPKLREDPPEDVQQEMDYVKDFLDHPNDNKGESFTSIIRSYLRDSLEIDAATLVKGFSMGSYTRHPAGGFELNPRGRRQLVELWSRDGGSFMKEVDVNGVEYRFWQYSYLHPAIAPLEFDVNEIAYGIRYPRSYSVYGWAELQSAETILNCLINSAFTNATMFQDYAVPQGVISFTGSEEDERRLAEYFRQEIRGRFYKVAVLNRDAKFTPIALTNRELEFTKGQQWFSRLIWALYKLTPTELGFQDEIRETGKAMAQQSKIQKRKSVMPALKLLELVFNNQIINEFSDRVILQFQYTDKEEEYAQDELNLNQLDRGLVTINELRQRRKFGAPVSWGDTPLPIQLAQMKASTPGFHSGGGGMPTASPEMSDMTTEGVWGGRSSQDFDFSKNPVPPVRAFNPSNGRWEDVLINPYDENNRQRMKDYWQAMGALGGRPDEPRRDGMLLPGEDPQEQQFRKERQEHPTFSDEQIQQIVRDHSQEPRRTESHGEKLGPMNPVFPHRTGPMQTFKGGDQERLGEKTRKPGRFDLFRGGHGAHKWERDNTHEGVDQRPWATSQGITPARRVTDPLTDVASRIVPTPPIRAGPIKHPRDVPPVDMATGNELDLDTDYTPATGKKRQPLGRIERARKFIERGLKELFVTGYDKDGKKYAGPDVEADSFEEAEDKLNRSKVQGELVSRTSVKTAHASESQLQSVLKSILSEYQRGVVDKQMAITEASAAIQSSIIHSQQAALHSMSKRLKKDTIQLPPELSDQYQRAKEAYLKDFEKILGDVKP